MLSILNFITGLSALLLIIVVLVQNQGSGLGDAFGGGTATNTYRSKRGLERGLFVMTIVLATILVVSVLARIVVS